MGILHLDYAVGHNPWTFEEVAVTVLEPLDKVPDGPGYRRGGRTETALKTASSGWKGISYRVRFASSSFQMEHVISSVNWPSTSFLASSRLRACTVMR